MELSLSLRASKTQASPLEGSGTFRAQQAETSLQQLGRREWWLWLSALLVSVLYPFVFPAQRAFLRNSLRSGALGNPMSGSSFQRLAGLQAMDVSATAEGTICE